MLLGLFGGTPRAASAWAARRALMSRVNAATAGGVGGGNASMLADESPLAALAATGGAAAAAAAGQSQLPAAGGGGQHKAASVAPPSAGPLSFRSDSHILVSRVGWGLFGWGTLGRGNTLGRRHADVCSLVNNTLLPFLALSVRHNALAGGG
jgi:hypothetical protein